MKPKSKPLPPGVFCPVITLYQDTPTQEVDLDAMYKHCQYLVNCGIHGLVYLGSNGEMALLTHEERQDIIRTARKAVTDLGKPDYSIVAGISAQSLKETIIFSRDAGEAGADWGLLLPPSYWSKWLSSEDIVQYYWDVADASPIPIVIYNLPAVVSGIDLDSDQISLLAAHPNIVAAKLTCGNIGKLTRLTSKFDPSHFAVYGGQSDNLLPVLFAGGVGCVTGLGNVFPKSVSAMFDLYREGKIEEARSIQKNVAHAEWACKKSFSCTKYGAWWFIGLRRLDTENSNTFNMRKPYPGIDEGTKKWVIDTLKCLEETEETLLGREESVKSE